MRGERAAKPRPAPWDPFPHPPELMHFFDAVLIVFCCPVLIHTQHGKQLFAHPPLRKWDIYVFSSSVSLFMRHHQETSSQHNRTPCSEGLRTCPMDMRASTMALVRVIVLDEKLYCGIHPPFLLSL